MQMRKQNTKRPENQASLYFNLQIDQNINLSKKKR